MTTIILTIIGILLAAAAALMVIFYGGDAFNSGSVGATANTYQNAGTSVVNAMQLAKADDYTYTGIQSLITPTDAAGNAVPSYLVNPSLPSGDQMGVSGDLTVAVINVSNADAVCARINTNLKLASTPTAATVPSFKMGCAPAGSYTFTTKPVFFAND